MTQNLFPTMALGDWQATRDTLAQYARVLGKMRRAVMPPQKHWWHVSLRPTAVGLTTMPLWSDGCVWEMVLNLTTHQTEIVTANGQQTAIPLTGQSAATYSAELKEVLVALGVTAVFPEEAYANMAGVYDPTAVTRFWQALTQITAVFTTFKHSFRHQSSPIQLWPHHFDLALLWLSGRLVPDQDPNDPDYADEQMNFGFITGDEAIPEPYFYVTAYPPPEEFTAQPLPEPAYWHTTGWRGAILPYRTLTVAEQPQKMLLDFLQTAHQAGATYMGVDAV